MKTGFSLQLTLTIRVPDIIQLPLRRPSSQLRMIRALFPNIPPFRLPTPRLVLLLAVRLVVQDVHDVLAGGGKKSVLVSCGRNDWQGGCDLLIRVRAPSGGNE